MSHPKRGWVDPRLIMASLLVSFWAQQSQGMAEIDVRNTLSRTVGQTQDDGRVTPALTAVSWRPTSVYVATYAGAMNYRDAVGKDSALLGGLYGSVGNRAYVLEGESDFTGIRSRGQADIRQWDLSLAYANYSPGGWRQRLGGHLIKCNDELTRDGLMMFSGIRYLDRDRWSMGVEGCYSSYPHYIPSLVVGQLTGHFGVNLFRGKTWSVWNDLREYWIEPSADVGFGKDSFLSTEDRVTLRWARASLAVFGWQGEQVFAARNDGLTVFNVAEMHKHGVGFEAACVFTGRMTGKIVVSHESFEQYGSAKESSVDLLLGMLVVRI